MAEERNKKWTQRALIAYTELQRAVAAVTSMQGQQLASFGLTTPQFAVLAALLLGGPVSITELGVRTLCTESNACVITRNLERRHLVARRADAADRRKVSVDLTAAGERLARKVWPVYGRVVRARMSVLESREQERLSELCQKLQQGDAVKFMMDLTRAE
jgi:DNA-binding MarR family transcriptional regulator